MKSAIPSTQKRKQTKSVTFARFYKPDLSNTSSVAGSCLYFHIFYLYIFMLMSKSVFDFRNPGLCMHDSIKANCPVKHVC